MKIERGLPDCEDENDIYNKITKFWLNILICGVMSAE